VETFADFVLGLPYQTSVTEYLTEVSLHQKHIDAYIQTIGGFAELDPEPGRAV